MSKARILYVSQHMVPFLPETPMSAQSRFLPQGAHDKGREIRVFMPRFGKINERRHQLHEVIRLSGMNLSIDEGYKSQNLKIRTRRTPIFHFCS